MPQLITEYLLISPTVDYAPVHCEILDNISFYGYQIYVDNIFSTKTRTTTFQFIALKNQKIDIVGVPAGEYNSDVSDMLSDDNGDKVAIELPTGYRGQVAIYSDAGTGIIDYGTRLALLDPSGCNSVGWGDESWQDFDWGEYSTAIGWGHQLYGTSTYGHGTAYVDVCVIFTTKRQSNGKIKFALVPVSNSSTHGTPYIITTTIQTRPDALKPEIRYYINTTDVLVIEALPQIF